MIAEVPPASAGIASGVLQNQPQQAAMGLGVASCRRVHRRGPRPAHSPDRSAYTNALAICMLVEAAFAVVFALYARPARR